MAARTPKIPARNTLLSSSLDGMDDIFNFETKEETNQPEQETQETSGIVPEMDFDLMEPFPDHKFKLYTGQRLEDMVESIQEFGILEPLILWKHEDRFTILSGHNRVNAARRMSMAHLVLDLISQQGHFKRAWVLGRRGVSMQQLGNIYLGMICILIVVQRMRMRQLVPIIQH